MLGKSLAVAAMALAATGAQARIAGVSLTGFENDPQGSELFFNLYNSEGQISYALDLGVRHVDMLSDPSQTLNYTIDAATSSAFAAFLNGSSAGQTMIWNIASAHNIFEQMEDLSKFGLLVTSKNSPIAEIQPGLANMAVNVDLRIGQLNAASGQTLGNKADNFDSVQTPGQAGYWADGWTTPFHIDSTAKLGEEAGFWWLGASDQDFFSGTVANLGNVWKFDIDFDSRVGTLTYGAVAPIPVPAAVWLFATGLISLIATKRRTA